MIKQLYEFCYCIYRKGLKNDTPPARKKSATNSAAQPSTDDDQEEAPEVENEEDEFLSSFLKTVYEESEAIHLGGDHTNAALKKKFISFMQVQVEDYLRKWQNPDIDWQELVERYPSEDFLKYKLQDEKRHALKINKYKDVQYIARLFNVFKWWRESGSANYPKLATAARIILVKPYHNGYQERVFSRGTYADGALRKRVLENHYEMRVLESLNHGNVARLFSSMQEELKASSTKHGDEGRYIKEFFDSGNNPHCETILVPHDVEEEMSLLEDEDETESELE